MNYMTAATFFWISTMGRGPIILPGSRYQWGPPEYEILLLLYSSLMVSLTIGAGPHAPVVSVLV